MHMAHGTAAWSLAELDRLLDDGNRYEVVRGELFVTPPPSVAHETLASVLGGILHAYTAAQRVGRVYHPRSVTRLRASQVEPDIMVRPSVAALPGRAAGVQRRGGRGYALVAA